MQDHLIKSTIFFQDLLCSYFQRLRRQIVETLVLLCVGSPSLWTLQPESSRRCFETSQSTSVSQSWVSESLSLEMFESTTRVCDGGGFHQRR